MFLSSFKAIRFGQFTAVTRDGTVTAGGEDNGNRPKQKKMPYNPKLILKSLLTPDAVQKKLNKEFINTYGGITVETRDGVVTIGQ